MLVRGAVKDVQGPVSPPGHVGQGDALCRPPSRQGCWEGCWQSPPAVTSSRVHLGGTPVPTHLAVARPAERGAQIPAWASALGLPPRPSPGQTLSKCPTLQTVSAAQPGGREGAALIKSGTWWGVPSTEQTDGKMPRGGGGVGEGSAPGEPGQTAGWIPEQDNDTQGGTQGGGSHHSLAPQAVQGGPSAGPGNSGEGFPAVREAALR